MLQEHIVQNIKKYLLSPTKFNVQKIASTLEKI